MKNPYKAIADFFNYCDLGEHRKYIDAWLNVVNSNHYWHISCPADLLLYYEELKNLIDAAYLIRKEKKKRKTARDLLQAKGLDSDKCLLHPALYFGWQPYCSIWDFFPRAINLEEYINPYLVFSRFFKFKSLEKWQEELRSLLVDGLWGKESSEDFQNGMDLLPDKKYLDKLIEAAHLIDVRENSRYRTQHWKKSRYTLDLSYPDIFVSTQGVE
jgi:hypothetical protein